MKASEKRGGRGASSIVFLGGGRLTAALVGGLRESCYTGQIIVHDRHPEKLAALAKRYGVRTETRLLPAAASAPILFIAVRPAGVLELLGRLRPLAAEAALHPRKMVVSLAAGVPLSSIRAALGPKFPIARAMPSPICTGGRGLTALAFPPRMTNAQRSSIRAVFKCLGTVTEIPEAHMDAFTAAYSVSHGYHALDALASAAQHFGLPGGLARSLAAHALADGVLCWRKGLRPLEDLLAEASTPGGIAEATASAMDRAGYRRSILAGLRAGISRARALGRSSVPRRPKGEPPRSG